MATAPSTHIDESALTKGQRRKLNALRKSVGNEIGAQAFAAWLSSQQAAGTTADANAAFASDAPNDRSSAPSGRWCSRARSRSRAAAICSGAGAGASSSSRHGRSLGDAPRPPVPAAARSG